MQLANLNNNLSSYVDFVMENYTVDTDFATNFALSVSQNCYQDSHTENVTNIIVVIFIQKCLNY